MRPAQRYSLLGPAAAAVPGRAPHPADPLEVLEVAPGRHAGDAQALAHLGRAQGGLRVRPQQVHHLAQGALGQPLGQGLGASLAGDAEDGVHLLLAVEGAVAGQHRRGGAEPAQPIRELVEPERLHEVLRHAVRDGAAHHRQVGGRGERQHPAVEAGRAQLVQEVQAVPVRQVHVQQHDVEREAPVRVQARRGDLPRGQQGAGHRGHLEARQPVQVRHVGLGRQLLVLDDEHPVRAGGHISSWGRGCGAPRR